jgi:hypothetical protein
MSASDIRAGGAFVEISAQDEKLDAQLLAVKGKLRRLGSDLRNLGRSAGAVSLIGEHASASSGPVGLLGAGIKGLSGSLGLIATGGALGVFVGIAVAATAMGSAFGASTAALEEHAAKLKEATDKGDKQRASDLERIERLQELSAQTDLTNADMAEADSILRLLTKTYGNLGLSLDTASNKINGVGEAQQRLNAIMKQSALAELRAQRQNILEQMESLSSVWHALDDPTALAQKRHVLDDQQKGLLARIEQLKQPEPTKDALAANEAKDNFKAVKAADAAAEHLKKLDEEALARNQTDLEKRIAGIQRETQEREKALNEMLRGERARVGGPRQHELDRLNGRLDSLGKESINEIQAERRQAHEKEIEERLKREEKYHADLAQLEVEASFGAQAQNATQQEKENLDLKKQLALLDLEYRQALQAAEVDGTDIGLVDKVYALKATLAEQAHQSPLKESVRGTFNADLAKYLGGNDPQLKVQKDQLAKLGQIDKGLERVQKAIEEGGVVA